METMSASLNDTTRDDLLKSGLSDETMQALQVRDVRPHDLRRLPVGVISAYRLPYFTLDGDFEDYARLRLFPPVKTNDGHTMKYYQQPASDPHAYLPPLFDWRAIAADPQYTVYIPEGEKKAAAGCQHGLPCVGIGGVWSWRVKVEHAGRITLPVFDQFTWAGRQVVMVPDSDAWRGEKQLFDILAGFYALAMDLSQRGASVAFKRLHDDVNGIKQGLDDFLLTPGVSFEHVEAVSLDDPRFKKLAAWYQHRPNPSAMEELLGLVKAQQVEIRSIKALLQQRYRPMTRDYPAPTEQTNEWSFKGVPDATN
jgi:hypothetical protein